MMINTHSCLLFHLLFWLISTWDWRTESTFPLKSFVKARHLDVSRSERAFLKLSHWWIRCVTLRSNIDSQITHLFRLWMLPFYSHRNTTSSGRLASNRWRIQTFLALMNSRILTSRSANLLQICQARLILEDFIEDICRCVTQFVRLRSSIILFWSILNLLIWGT